MSRYRKVDPRIWNDAKFRSMTDNGKLAFLMLLTHPGMTALGGMRSTVPGLAEELGWTTEAFREAFREALRKGMAKHDEKACLIVLPNFLRYNRPESPNVVKAWVESLDLLPECALKAQLIEQVRDFAKGMSEAFAKALPQAFAKPMPYQEQEQEQEQEQDVVPLAPSPEAAPPALFPQAPPWIEFPTNRPGELFSVLEQQIAHWAQLYPAVDVQQQLRNMRGWLDARPTERKTLKGLPQFISRWLQREQNDAGTKRHGGGNGTGIQTFAERKQANTINGTERVVASLENRDRTRHPGSGDGRRALTGTANPHGH